MSDPAFRAALDAAIDLSDDRKWKAALKAFDRLVKTYPGEMQPRFERAMVLLSLDRDQDAIADLEHVLKHDADYPGARDWYARAQAGNGKPLLAAQTKLEELQALAPEDWSANGQAWADCARYFLEAGAPERALAALDIYFARYEGKQKDTKVTYQRPIGIGRRRCCRSAGHRRRLQRRSAHAQTPISCPPTNSYASMHSQRSARKTVPLSKCSSFGRNSRVRCLLMRRWPN
jgi:hypothetical protein